MIDICIAESVKPLLQHLVVDSVDDVKIRLEFFLWSEIRFLAVTLVPLDYTRSPSYLFFFFWMPFRRQTIPRSAAPAAVRVCKLV